MEDLVSTIVGRYEGVVEWPLETHLAHEVISRHRVWNSSRWSNHPGEGRWDSTGASGGRHCSTGTRFLDDA